MNIYNKETIELLSSLYNGTVPSVMSELQLISIIKHLIVNCNDEKTKAKLRDLFFYPEKYQIKGCFIP
jgi:hypothetical protein